MSYSDFRLLPDVLKRFSLAIREEAGLFAACPPVAPSALLVETLQLNVPLAFAIANEKARSELIVAPVLLELKRARPSKIGYFSGVELSVDVAAGLTGTCDFLLTLAPEQLFVSAPIVTLVEAKKEDLAPGMAQCVAEMMGAQLFNERAGNAIPTVYGAVTSGFTWRFMSLTGSTVAVDLSEHHVNDVDRVLGILTYMTSPRTQP